MSVQILSIAWFINFSNFLDNDKSFLREYGYSVHYELIFNPHPNNTLSNLLQRRNDKEKSFCDIFEYSECDIIYLKKYLWKLG